MIASPAYHLQIPSRNTITSLLFEKAGEAYERILQMIPQNRKVSIALDCWTSPDQKPFMAILGYFIDDDFRYHEVLLGFPPLPGSHTGSQLALVVQELLQKYGLSHRILGLTTDNASNNGTMFDAMTARLKSGLDEPLLLDEAFDDDFARVLMNSLHHFPCLTHVIQLSVTAFLKQLKITPKNDDPSHVWDEKDVEFTEQGILRTLEKVSFLNTNSNHG